MQIYGNRHMIEYGSTDLWFYAVESSRVKACGTAWFGTAKYWFYKLCRAELSENLVSSARHSAAYKMGLRLQCNYSEKKV